MSDLDLLTDRPAATREREPEKARSVPGAPSRWKRRAHHWLRVTHGYVSVISLLIVLFFGITGITLNHPDWTLGTNGTMSTATGVLPPDSIAGGEVEFLLVSEFTRAEHGVRGEVSDFGVEGDEATITYKAPGYAAEVAADVATGDYSLTVREEGFVSVMNDLHKGRDASTAWRWIIDVSGALLVVIGLTGIGIQFFLRRRRISALSLAVAGGVLTTILIWVAATT